jgi:hypothetical protein
MVLEPFCRTETPQRLQGGDSLRSCGLAAYSPLARKGQAQGLIKQSASDGSIDLGCELLFRKPLFFQ